MQSHRVLLDPISLMCILTAFFVFGINMTTLIPLREDPIINDVFLKNIVAFGILIGCLTMMLVTGIYNPKTDQDYFIDAKELNTIIIWVIIDLFVILMIEIITFTYSPLSAIAELGIISVSGFSVLMGWSEEVLRAVILIYGSRIADETSALFVSTFIWTIYHGGVYGLDFKPMLIIFGSGIILGASILANNGRISVSMLPHGINNLLAHVSGKSIFKIGGENVLRILLSMVK